MGGGARSKRDNCAYPQYPLRGPTTHPIYYVTAPPLPPSPFLTVATTRRHTTLAAAPFLTAHAYTLTGLGLHGQSINASIVEIGPLISYLGP